MFSEKSFGFVWALSFVLLCSLIPATSAQWGFSPEQTEVFDLVDETRLNFYDFLGVSKDAATSAIRRSYRKLSLTMHPDKNKTEGAEEGFRILVAMYEILKNKEKREIYDDVLVNGLPGAYLYVPRQIRKMSMMEVSIIISLIFTVGHFLFMWGSYIERKFTLDEMLPRIYKQKKKRKKVQNSEDVDEAIEALKNQIVTKPTFWDVLPILLARKLYAFVFWLPMYIKARREHQRMMLEMEKEKKLEEEEAERRAQEQLVKRTEAKKIKQERNKQKKEEYLLAQKLAAESGPQAPSVFDNPSQSIEELEALYDEMDDEQYVKKKKSKSNQWSEDDQSELVALMTKYPGGTSERWQKISKEMGRTVQQVTAKAKLSREFVGAKVKQVPAVATSKHLKKAKQQEALPSDDHITTRYELEDGKTKSAGDEGQAAPDDESKSLSESTNNTWGQNEQKLLEQALTQFPKSVPERWNKIADCIPGKTKEECIMRYKFLADKILQKRKQAS